MTQFDLRSRFDDVAAGIEPGPVRPLADIEVEALRQRRARRARWGGAVAAAAAVVVAIGVPVLLGDGSDDSSPAPAPADPVPTTAEDNSPCTRTTATGDRHRALLLVQPECTTTPVPLTDVTAISYTSLSPDGSTIAFVNLHDHADDALELVDIESGDRRTLATSSDTLGDPVWSPDGERIAFWRAEGGASRIFVVDDETGDVTRLSRGTADAMPAWSPDGSTVAFSRSDGRTRLWAVDVASGEERQLPEAPSGLRHPFWGTNNRQFLFGVEVLGSITDPSPSFRILELDPDTGRPTGFSETLSGMPTDAVYDDYGIHVAALTVPAQTSVVTTLGYDLTAINAYTVDNAEITVLRARPTPPQTPSGTTSDGRTYGGSRPGRQPDLLAVELDSGVAYVARRDLNEPPPSSPTEAGEWQERRNDARYPAYARDGVTLAGVFDIAGGDGPRLLTTTTAPPGTERTSITGILEIDEDGCSYLDDGTTRHLLIWPWVTQLADAAGPPDTIEDWVADRPVAQAGDTLTLDGDHLEGQRVEGGPCSAEGAPLYVSR
jgi:dipeptidyl aminopeptidase/acylaminoacyl peptidase